MATIIKCDRCGLLLEKKMDVEIKPIKVVWQNMYNSFTSEDLLFIEKDLCKRCTRKVINILTEKLEYGDSI